MNRTTVFLSDEHIGQISEEADRTGLKSAEIIRNALTWYFAFRTVTRDSLGEFAELLKVYEEMTPEQILIKLVADDKRRRSERNTKENGIAAIKEDTTAIRAIVERELGSGDNT